LFTVPSFPSQDPNKDIETELQNVMICRLQEALPFPIPEYWSKTIWDYGLDAGFIQRPVTGGDCQGGVRIDLTKSWWYNPPIASSYNILWAYNPL
jgi:hypothetical protein